MPFIKIDKGLEAEANGVQLMKPIPDSTRCSPGRQGPRRVRHQGALGRSTSPIREGIAAIVRQQFEVARQVLAAGLVPILEPEVNIKSPERAEADRILLEELVQGASTRCRATTG